jgi:hypothetical protein
VSEETESCLVFPLGTTIAHLAGRNTRASQAEVRSSDNGNAHLSIDIATHNGVRLLLPLLSQERAAGLLDKTSTDGAYGKWIHRFGQHDIGLHIDENL